MRPHLSSFAALPDECGAPQPWWVIVAGGIGVAAGVFVLIWCAWVIALACGLDF